MRVFCETLDDYLEALGVVPTIFEDAIRVNITSRPLGESKEPTVFQIVFQAGAVVQVDDDREYLLETALVCGKDYHDESHEMAGTQKAEEIRNRLSVWAEARNWRLLPGVIGF